MKFYSDIAILTISLIVISTLQFPVNFQGIDNRVVGGHDCEIQQVPFIVSVVKIEKGGNHFICGGVLLTFNYVLTAAHCVSSKRAGTLQFIVGAGSRFNICGIKGPRGKRQPTFGFQKIAAARSIKHQKYNGGNLYDIGILIMRIPFKKSPTVGTASLPTTRKFYKKCKTATVIGWGEKNKKSFYKDLKIVFDRHNPMKCAEIPILHDVKDCQKKIEAVANEKMKPNLDESVICALDDETGQDACNGDSGGPLVCDNVVIGLVAAGLGCGLLDSPGVYTNVVYFYKFIMETTGMHLPFSSEPPGFNESLPDRDDESDKDINNSDISVQVSKMFVLFLSSFIVILNLMHFPFKLPRRV